MCCFFVGKWPQICVTLKSEAAAMAAITNCCWNLIQDATDRVREREREREKGNWRQKCATREIETCQL
jgi:hypothetical protein